LDQETAKILVVDDDDGVRAVAMETFARADYEVVGAATGQQATELLGEHDFAAAVVDLVLPDCSGLQILEQVRTSNPDVVMLVITGYASLDSAMEAVRLGAYEYLRKPFEADDLLHIVQRGLKERELARENRELLAELDRTNRELVAYRDRLESQMQLTSEKLEAFIELGKRLAASEGALPRLADVLEAAIQVAGAGSGAVFSLADDGFDCVVARGEARADLHGVHLRSDEGVFEAALMSGEAAVIPDLVTWDGADNCAMCLLGFASMIVLPLKYQDLTLGMMSLYDWEPLAFAEGHLNLLQVLVSYAANLLASGQLQGQAQALATDDGFVDIADMLS